MARAIVENLESLAANAGLSKRLTMRLVSLARRGFLISEVILELLGEGERSSPLQKILLAPELAGESAPAPESVQALVAANVAEPYFSENPLQVVTEGDLICLAISDEGPGIQGITPTEKAQTQASQDAPKASSTALSVVAAPQGALLSTSERGTLFKEDQLAALKLTLLTSTHADDKIEALRKLWLSPIPDDDKAALFIVALRDKNADVRAEAVRGLGGMGLDERVTGNLADACAGDEALRLVALANLGQLMPKMAERERNLALNMLVGLIDRNEPRRVASETLNVLRPNLGPLAYERRDLVAEVHGRLRQLLSVQTPELHHSARQLYRELAAADPEHLASLLLRTLDEVAQPHLVTFLVSVLAAIPSPGVRTPEVLSLLVTTYLDASEFDASFMALSSALTAIGQALLPAVFAAFEDPDERRQRRLLTILVDMLRNPDISAESMQEALHMVLRVFERGSQDMRHAVYDSGLLRLENADDELRTQAARLMLADVHEHELEAQREMVIGNILQLGPPAFAPTLRALEESSRDLTVSAACDILSSMLERMLQHEGIESQLADALPRLEALVQRDDMHERGALLRLLGQVAGARVIDADGVDRVAAFLQQEASQSSHIYDAVAGLGWIASGESITEQERMELCHLLIGFLTLDNPRLKGRDRRDEDGETVLELSRDTTAHTVLIPRVLAALTRVIERKGISPSLFRHIVSTLTRQFHRVANYKVIWAPASSLALAQLLGASGSNEHADTHLRERLAEALLLKANMLPVLRVLCRLCLTELSPRMDLLSVEVYERLWAMAEKLEEMELSERRDVLESLSTLLLRAHIGSDPASSRRYHSQIIDVLFKELRSRVPGVLDMLRRLSTDERIPSTEREDMTQRLQRFGVRSRR